MYNILLYPDPFLRKVARPVDRFDASLADIARVMTLTMHQYEGIGLAATQVGLDMRIFVMNTINKEPEDTLVFVNPFIESKDGAVKCEEGCLSLPEQRAEVQRSAQISLQYQTLQGDVAQSEFSGLEAICVQHELDHLNGVLFIDHISPLKRHMITKKMKKLSP